MSAADQHAGGVLLPDGRVFFASFSSYDLAGALAAVELYDPATGVFNVAGTTTALAHIATATGLNDGRVLVTGGNYHDSAYGAEIYDAVAGTSAVLSSSLADEPFAATALTDGRVLFQFYEASAQVFEPASGRFSSIGGLFGFDGPPQASVLLNGMVLFTGGNDIGGSENSVEMFDPAAGTFAHMAKMAIARDGHTSNLLPDGTVLLAGGSLFAFIGNRAVANSDLYDSVAGSFSSTGYLGTGRADHTATLLDNGQVLITGGSTFGSPNSISGLSTAEVYTPTVLIPAPVLFSFSGDGRGQGVIWHATTGQIASPGSPAVAGDVLSMYTISLADGGLIPPQVVVGGRLAEVLFFGAAPGYRGYYQVNFRIPSGVEPGAAVPVRLTYLGRLSNQVAIGVQ